MNGELVVKRYAKALFETARKHDKLDLISKDIKTLSEILSEEEIRSFCLKEGTDQRVKQEFADTAFVPYISDFTGRLVALMVKNGRMEALPFLESAFREIESESKNFVPVTLETAESGSDLLYKLVEEKMSRRLGKNIILSTVLKPGIIGGFRIVWQNRIIDMSDRGKIKKLKALLQ